MKELKIASIVYLHTQSISFQHNNAAAKKIISCIKGSESERERYNVTPSYRTDENGNSTCDLYHALELNIFKWEISLNVEDEINLTLMQLKRVHYCVYGWLYTTRHESTTSSTSTCYTRRNEQAYI